VFTTGLNPQSLTNQVQQTLGALRNAIDAVDELYAWSSGVSEQELIDLGFATSPGDDTTSPDALAILSACADANAIAVIYRTGQAPESYPQVTGDPYVFAESIARVLGPRRT